MEERCFACQGPRHEATGHRFEGFYGVVLYCGPCARHMVAWVKGMMGRRFDGKRFYEAVDPSCVPWAVEKHRKNENSGETCILVHASLFREG